MGPGGQCFLLVASCCFLSTLHQSASATVAQLQGKPDAAGSSPAAASVPPPPPPTVAPKAALERKPKARSAYRRQKQSTEERRQQLQEQQAAQQQMRAGHEEVLSPEAMVAKAAALQADHRGRSQKWLKQILQPLTDLAPALLPPQLQHANRRSSSGSTAGAAPTPTVLVIDGYNLLHQHSSTKQLILQDRMHEAQARLHTLLRAYTQQQQGGNLHALVVYDAHSVSRNSSSTRQQLGGRLHTVYKAGQEADSVIISLVESLLQREAAAAAAGHLGLYAPTFCTLLVHTNDNRITSAVADADLSAARHMRQHVVRVQVGSSSQLSAQLQLVENKLFAGQEHKQQQQPHQQQQLIGGRLPDPRDNTEAWARAILARSGSASSSRESDSDSEEPSSSSSSIATTTSSSKRRRRRLTQQQQLEEEGDHARLLAAGLSDEQLLQLSASGGALVAAVSSVDDVEGVEQAAAVAAGEQQKPSSSTSQQLDEVLSMDIDSLLDGL